MSDNVQAVDTAQAIDDCQRENEALSVALQRSRIELAAARAILRKVVNVPGIPVSIIKEARGASIFRKQPADWQVWQLGFDECTYGPLAGKWIVVSGDGETEAFRGMVYDTQEAAEAAAKMSNEMPGENADIFNQRGHWQLSNRQVAAAFLQQRKAGNSRLATDGTWLVGNGSRVIAMRESNGIIAAAGSRSIDNAVSGEHLDALQVIATAQVKGASVQWQEVDSLSMAHWERSAARYAKKSDPTNPAAPVFFSSLDDTAARENITDPATREMMRAEDQQLLTTDEEKAAGFSDEQIAKLMAAGGDDTDDPDLFTA